MTVAVDGTGLSPLTTDSVNAGMPSWSPDGKQVVFRRATGTEADPSNSRHRDGNDAEARDRLGIRHVPGVVAPGRLAQAEQRRVVYVADGWRRVSIF